MILTEYFSLIDCRKVGIKISNDMKIILFDGRAKPIVSVKFD